MPLTRPIFMSLLTPFMPLAASLRPLQSTCCLLPCYRDSFDTIIEVEKLATNIPDLEHRPANLLQALRSPWCLDI